MMYAGTILVFVMFLCLPANSNAVDFYDGHSGYYDKSKKEFVVCGSRLDILKVTDETLVKTIAVECPYIPQNPDKPRASSLFGDEQETEDVVLENLERRKYKIYKNWKDAHPEASTVNPFPTDDSDPKAIEMHELPKEFQIQ